MKRLPEATLRRQAIELFLLTRSFEEVSKSLKVPKAVIMRWAYEDNWNEVVQRESEAVRSLASVKVAEAKIDLAKNLIDALNHLITEYASKLQPETLTELIEVVQKGAEVLDRLLGAQPEQKAAPSAKAAVVNLIGGARTLFQTAIEEIDAQDITNLSGHSSQ